MRASQIQTYYACDALSGLVICLGVVFSPWAFGTTQSWSVWTMNLAGCLLALLLALKLGVIRFTGYAPVRWREPGSCRTAKAETCVCFNPQVLTALLALLTATLLAYCFVSALNARATFHDATLAFTYYDCVSWLPHSYDSTATWFAFWTYLGLAGWFWGIWHWLRGKSLEESRMEMSAKTGLEDRARGAVLPQRLRVLLWALAISGALLAVEGLAQRLANSPRLLFLVVPRIHQTAETQFGPYAYRSNAAQYFNLLWPVCVGFWWSGQRLEESDRGRHATKGYEPRSAETPAPASAKRCYQGQGRRGWHSHRDWLLASAAVMAACPLICGSRAGAFVTLGMMIVIGWIALTQRFWFAAHRRRSQPSPDLELSGARAAATQVRAPALALSLGSAFLMAWALGWGALKPRLADMSLAGRNELCEAARPMARDFPWFGTGPGTYETVSQLYPRPAVFWPAQLHNDWLETRITFGYVGTLLILLALGTVLARSLVPSGMRAGSALRATLWLAMAGCLAHAWVDFPFQIHSVLLLFVIWCAMLFRGGNG